MKRVRGRDLGKPEVEFLTAGEAMSLDEKYEFLKSLGHSDLIAVFKDYKSTKTRAKPKSAPLDQRVVISVTALERIRLTKELKELEKMSEKVSISQYIRNKATRQVDLQEWRELAEAELEKIAEIEKDQKELRRKKASLILEIADEDTDEEDIPFKEREIATIDNSLNLLIARGERRPNRLNGRMTMAEAEIVRWRAEQLFLSVSDYLRIMLFDLFPGGAGDAHLGLDARKRFYGSIIRVSLEGWGKPPTVYECSQCSHYVEEIRILRDKVDQLEAFV